jgi:hypothetical protein
MDEDADTDIPVDMQRERERERERETRILKGFERCGRDSYPFSAGKPSMAVSWHRPESWCQAWFDPFGLPTISIHDPAVCMHATQSIPWSSPTSLWTSRDRNHVVGLEIWGNGTICMCDWPIIEQQARPASQEVVTDFGR